MDIKKIIQEEVGDFEWIDNVDVFDLNDRKWVISANGKKEWFQVVNWLYNNGWTWYNNKRDSIEYEERFNCFFPVLIHLLTLYSMGIGWLQGVIN